MVFEFLNYRAATVRLLVEYNSLKSGALNKPRHFGFSGVVAAVNNKNFLLSGGELLESVNGRSTSSGEN